MGRIVVVLGDTVTALGTLRAVKVLKKKGYFIISAASGQIENYAFYSNIPDRKVILRNGLTSGLLLLAKELDEKPILLFNRDDEVVEISKNRDRLSPYYDFLLPDQETIKLLMEKGRFTKFAQEKGLPLPLTAYIRNEQDLCSVTRKLPYPIIVKPYLMHAIRVDDEEQLRNLIARLEPKHYHSMIAQEYIEGRDDRLYFAFLLFDRAGRVVHSMTARKLRQWPVSYGTTSLAETVDNAVFRAEVENFIAVIKGAGYCSIEYKYHPESGRFLIMEPTVGRFNQQVGLTVAAGVNFPLATVQLLCGETVIEKSQKNNVLWVFESNDLLSRFRSGKQYGYLKNFFKPHNKVLFSWTDPMPLFYEMYFMGRKKVRKLLKHV